jgi:hypothetical protein
MFDCVWPTRTAVSYFYSRWRSTLTFHSAIWQCNHSARRYQHPQRRFFGRLWSHRRRLSVCLLSVEGRRRAGHYSSLHLPRHGQGDGRGASLDDAQRILPAQLDEERKRGNHRGSISGVFEEVLRESVFGQEQLPAVGCGCPAGGRGRLAGGLIHLV